MVERAGAVVPVLSWAHVPGRIERLRAQRAGWPARRDHPAGAYDEGPRSAGFEPDPQGIWAVLDILEQGLLGEVGVFDRCLRLDDDESGIPVPGQAHGADAELFLDRLLK